MLNRWIPLILVVLLVGVGLLLGWGTPRTLDRPQAATTPTPIEQGVLALRQGGQLLGKEAFVLFRQGEGFELLTQGKLQTPQLEERLTTALRLTTEFVPLRYALLRVVEQKEGEGFELLSGQTTFSERQAHVSLHWTLPEPIDREQALEIPSPFVILESDALSHIVVVPRLFQSLGGEEATVAILSPILQQVDVAQLRRLDPVEILFDGREGQAERLLLSRGGRETELFLQGGEFIGAVRTGEEEPFIFRWDLFPQSFRVRK